MRKIELLAMAGILLLGAFFRFYLINEIPPGLYPDEATNGNNAIEALETGQFRLFYPENNGREGFFINLQAFSVLAFGAEPWALRLVSAVFGAITVFGVYLLAKELFISYGRSATLIALLSSFFIATNYWHINFSRIGFRAILVPFLASFGMYFLLKALRGGKIWNGVLAGIFIGLGFHTYIAFRFMPFVLLIPIGIYLYRWLRPPTTPSPIDQSTGLEGKSCTPCIVILFIFIAFISALPLGLYFVNHPGDFFGRGGQVSIFSSERPVLELAKSNLLTLQMFFFSGDCNPRHNLVCQPELYWIAAIFFGIGLLLIAKNAFQRTDKLLSWTLIAWLLFMSFPATLTREGLPHALRAIGLIPPVMIITGWGAAYIFERVREYLSRAAENADYQKYRPQILRIKKEVAALFMLILALVALEGYRDYFIRFPSRPETYDAFAVDLLEIGKYINALPRETKKFVVVLPSNVLIRGVPAPAQTTMFASDTFSETKRLAKNVFYVTGAEEIKLSPEEKAVVIPMNPAAREEIKRRFPKLTPYLKRGFISFEG